MTEKKNEVRVRRVGTATLGIALILTGSIWLGALVNALLIGWTTVSSMGYNTYFAQDFISIFFNV